MGESGSHMERVQSTSKCSIDDETNADGSQRGNQGPEDVSWTVRAIRWLSERGLYGRILARSSTSEAADRVPTSQPHPNSTPLAATSRRVEQGPNTASQPQPAFESAAATTPKDQCRDCSTATSDAPRPPVNTPLTTARDTAAENLMRLVMIPTTSSTNTIEGLLPGLTENVTRAFIAAMQPGRLIRLDWSDSRVMVDGVYNAYVFDGPKSFLDAACKIQAQEKTAIEYWNEQTVKFHGWMINEECIWHFEACLRSGCARCVEEVLKASHRQCNDSNATQVEDDLTEEESLILLDFDTEGDMELEDSNGDSSEQTVEPVREEVLLGIDNYLSTHF